MAPETSKHKPAARNSFDDELGDDFLSSWKPSKSLAALDFEDDEPAPKNRKASFSLAKMDTSFDFDFDGGLNALSKFNVDMDLDMPSSREKSLRTKDSSREKQPCADNKKCESKFSFQFNGFDELDLDDTLKTRKQPETPLHSKKGKRDSSPTSTASKCRKKSILDSLSEDVSESTSIPTDGVSMKKESLRTWSESAHDQGRPLGRLAFSDEENSAHESGHPVPRTKEQISKSSDSYTPQKSRDSDLKDSTAFPVQVTQVVSPNPAQANDSVGYKSSTTNLCSKDSDIEISTALSAEVTNAVSTAPAQLHQEPERATRSEVDVESGKKPSCGMNLDVSSSDCGRQELAVNEESLIEESNSRMDANEFPQPKLTMKESCNNNLMLQILEESYKDEKDEKEKRSACNLKLRQEASSDGNSLLKEEKVSTNHLCEENASTSPVHGSLDAPVGSSGTKLKRLEADLEGIGKLIASEPHTSPTEVSPTARPAKRKFSVEGMTSESPSSKQNSSKNLEVDGTSKGDEVQEISDSATSQKKCRDSHSSLEEKHQDVTPIPLLCRTASKLVADRSSKGAVSFKKTTILPSLQSPRSLLGSPEYHSSHQRKISLVNGKSSTTHLQSTTAAQKKPIMLGGLQSPSLPSISQPNRGFFKLNSMKDIPSSTILQVRSRPSTEKKFEGVALRKTSGLALLSKTRVMGTLRESCEKTFRMDFATSKGTSVLPITHLRKSLASPKIAGNCDEKYALENPDTEMADVQKTENLKNCLDKDIVQTNASETLMMDAKILEISDKEMVQANGDESHPAVSLESDAGIVEESEFYADHLDQLLKDLKIKYEEAMDLRVRAMVINNSFMMLNNPIDDEKIRKITHYVREKLCLDMQGPPMTQPS